MSKVHHFLTRYPATDGYTLICVCEEINRRTQAAVGVDGILTQALLLDHAGEYLAAVCANFQNQKGQ